MFPQQLEFWNFAEEIPFFCFVEHPAQSSQCTVGIGRRAAETEPLHIVLCYVIQAHANEVSLRKQAPAVTVVFLSLPCQGRLFDPFQELTRETLQADSTPV